MIARRGVAHGSGLGKVRWVVERTFAWLHQFKRLRVRSEDPRRFEEGFRAAMRSLADSGRALETNTRRLWPWIPQWWTEEGGRAITFGSDAHEPEAVADNFPEAVAIVEFFGFRPGRRAEDIWTLQRSLSVSTVPVSGVSGSHLAGGGSWGSVEMWPGVTRHAPIRRRMQSMSTVLVYPQVRRI